MFIFNNIVIKGTISSTTSPASSGVNNIVDSLSKSSQQEEELLGLAGFEQLLRAKLESYCLWDWAKRRIPAPEQPSTELGEPDVECITIIINTHYLLTHLTDI